VYRSKLRFGGRRGLAGGGCAARHRRLCREYLRGLAWTLLYYTRGCASWGWFFPFHYGPFVSDLPHGIAQHCIYEIGFSLGRPYTPLQQVRRRPLRPLWRPL
jgi:5'-3' exonuclease